MNSEGREMSTSIILESSFHLFILKLINFVPNIELLHVQHDCVISII